MKSRTLLLLGALTCFAQDTSNTWDNNGNTWDAAAPSPAAGGGGENTWENTWAQESSETWEAEQTQWQPTSTQYAAAPAETGYNPWTGTGSASFYWHTRYHGNLAMSAYGNYRETCPQAFTRATLQRQYPGNTNQPFEVVDQWDNIGTYNQSGYSVRVPEMNKILMIFKGNYGWQSYNATLVPFLGIGCDATCKVHAGALAAWHEVKAHTNDMARIKATQQNLVWSASGHGFGGMVAQVAAMDLKYRGFTYSAQSFGSPPVFNPAAAAQYDRYFEGDASQRTVANGDSVPAMLPIGTGPNNYTFVNTGIHVYGTSSMYGQNYEVCQGWNADPRCAGGNNEADHYFYFSDLGACGSHYTETYDTALNARLLASESRNYMATASAQLTDPVTSFSSVSMSSSIQSSSSANVTATEVLINATQNANANNAAAQTTSTSADSSAQSTTLNGLLGVCVVLLTANFW